jgi:hypothetical protein
MNVTWPAGSVITESNESKSLETAHWFNDADIVALCEDVYLICKQLAERQPCVTAVSPLSGAALTLSASTFNAPPLPSNVNDVDGTVNGMKTLKDTEVDDMKPRAPTGYDLSGASVTLTL